MQVKNNGNWKVDSGHSTVQFKVKHMAIANVSGTFNTFEGQVSSGGIDFEDALVNFNIEAESLNTNNRERDQHLRSELFFDTQRFPQLIFAGRLVKGKEDYELLGALTIRDVTKQISLQAEFTGAGEGRFGDKRAGFELNGKINRKDYGLTWSMLTEAGGLIVGEEIKLHFDIELVKI
jgi:polyisoprenoid-binding protein YceI